MSTPVVMGPDGVLATCRGCGITYPNLPEMDVSLFLAVLRQIERDHAACQPKATEGARP